MTPGFDISSVSRLDLPMIDGAGAAAGQTPATGGFGDLLAGKIEALGDQQQAASEAMIGIATGQEDDLAQSMLQIEEANVSMQVAMQLRNKAVEAYQEIMRMQI